MGFEVLHLFVEAFAFVSDEMVVADAGASWCV